MRGRFSRRSRRAPNGSASARSSHRSPSGIRPCWRSAPRPRRRSRAAASSSGSEEAGGAAVELGRGGGWYHGEHETYGFAFPPVRERMDALDAHLEEIRRQWGEADDVWPKPSPPPHVIVGGGAKPRTVRAAVGHADEYNTTFATVDEARERRQIVDAAAHAAGREPLTFSLM